MKEKELDCHQIISELKALSSDKYKANTAKLGIPIENSIGVSTGDLRKLAKTLPKSNACARALWDTGYHEAKLLAVLLFDQKTVTLEMAATLMEKVFSWDLCDHLCKNLLIKLRGYEKLIWDWANLNNTYHKRAVFTMIAAAAVHEKALQEEIVDSYLKLIKANAADERQHVKQAVSWALRELGKRNFSGQEKAALVAHELIHSENKHMRWVGKDALKEIENLVEVSGRKRLISADSQMGKNRDKIM